MINLNQICIYGSKYPFLLLTDKLKKVQSYRMNLVLRPLWVRQMA
jgi:hypothetical protein